MMIELSAFAVAVLRQKTVRPPPDVAAIEEGAAAFGDVLRGALGGEAGAPKGEAALAAEESAEVAEEEPAEEEQGADESAAQELAWLLGVGPQQVVEVVERGAGLGAGADKERESGTGTGTATERDSATATAAATERDSATATATAAERASGAATPTARASGAATPTARESGAATASDAPREKTAAPARQVPSTNEARVREVGMQAAASTPLDAVRRAEALDPVRDRAPAPVGRPMKKPRLAIEIEPTAVVGLSPLAVERTSTNVVAPIEKPVETASVFERPASVEIDARVATHVDRLALRRAVEAQVDDPELGRVAVRIETAPAGLDVRMTAENAATATLLKQSQTELEAHLVASSVPVTNVAVVHATESSAFSGQLGHGSDRSQERGQRAGEPADAPSAEADKPKAARAAGRRVRAVL